MHRHSSAVKKCCALAALAAAGTPLFSAEAKESEQERPAAETRAVFSILDDNDFFGGWSDKYYTNHTRLALTLGADATEKIREAWFFSIGQEMYTPKDREAKIPAPNDHPYAAYLYASAGRARFGDHFAMLTEIQLGATGDWALGKQIQMEYHRFLDEVVPRGWDTQIHRRVVGQAIGEIRHRIMLDGACGNGGWGADALVRGSGGIGNLRGILSVGTQFRAGWNLPKDFGAGTMRQSTSVVFDPQVDWSVYGFFDVQGDAVLWDKTLTSNNGGGGSDICAYPFAAQFTLGLCFIYDRFMFSTFQSFRTKDFSAQDEEFFAYGGFKLSVLF